MHTHLTHVQHVRKKKNGCLYSFNSLFRLRGLDLDLTKIKIKELSRVELALGTFVRLWAKCGQVSRLYSAEILLCGWDARADEAKSVVQSLIPHNKWTLTVGHSECRPIIVDVC